MMKCALLVALAIVTPASSLSFSTQPKANLATEESTNPLTAAIWSKAAPQVKNAKFGRIAKTEDMCKDLIHKPSTGEYNLDNKEAKSWSQVGQDLKLAGVLDTMKNGFFIESGAANGELNSNTLGLEKFKGWSGLLVEPNPNTFKTLLGKNRKAHSYNGALSVTGEFGTFHMTIADCAGKPGDGQCSGLVDEGGIEVQVAPVHELLKCMGRSTVDFWSLDVEGVEGQILKGFSFKDTEVGMMLIEMNKSDKNNRAIEGVMTENGFKECGRTEFDRVYVNPAYFEKRSQTTPTNCVQA